MNAFVFGAGASFSYDQSPTGQRPPLAREFFSTYTKLDIASDFEVKVQWLLQYVKRTRGVDYEVFGDWNEDIEAFLTELDQKLETPEKALALDFEERIIVDGAFKETVLLFASVLNEIQNGPVAASYASLVGGLNDQDALITFNWDTLLDRALFDAGNWFADDGYGVSFKAVMDEGWRDSLPTTSSRTLLKLHGSTNWLMPYQFLHQQTGERSFMVDPGDANDRTMFCYVQSQDEYATYQRRWRGGYQPFSYWYYPPNVPTLDESMATSALFAMMPMIVPPVQHKDYDLMSGVLHPIWKAAEEKIALADELFLIGYSFPITDVRAIDLLSAALDRRGSSLRTTIVNPWPDEIATRLRTTFGERLTVATAAVSFADWAVPGI